MDYKMKSCNPKLNNELKIFEQCLGFRLPQDYKLFLEKVNGGTPHNRYFLYRNNDGSIINTFFGITEDPDNDIIKFFRDNKTTLPNNMLPIGDDQGSNLILICINGDNYGNIFFLDHELPIFKIADSFSEFINNLKSEEEMENA